MIQLLCFHIYLKGLKCFLKTVPSVAPAKASKRRFMDMSVQQNHSHLHCVALSQMHNCTISSTLFYDCSSMLRILFLVVNGASIHSLDCSSCCGHYGQVRFFPLKIHLSFPSLMRRFLFLLQFYSHHQVCLTAVYTLGVSCLAAAL